VLPQGHTYAALRKAEEDPSALEKAVLVCIAEVKLKYFDSVDGTAPFAIDVGTCESGYRTHFASTYNKDLMPLCFEPASHLVRTGAATTKRGRKVLMKIQDTHQIHPISV
jgi:hypothetical protein